MGSLSTQTCLGVLAPVLGAPMVAWGLWSWHHPASLRPDMALHRFFLADWAAWPRRSPATKRHLTHRQVRYYAIRTIAAGGIVCATGVVHICCLSAG